DARAKKTYRDLQGNTVRTPKGFGLQIAVYANEDYAKTLGADVASKGFSNVYIESFYNSKNGVTYYRVIYGEFETMQMTAPESKKLLQAGFDAHFIYTYPKD
ncbi:MAG TPA: SPOR domain-containing protein, partial [Leptospiraceae bacterium]|nr:SPOR domain-containing protein [Leptospiraceae bacterium]